MSINHVALFLSNTGGSDVSIDAQRRELTSLAHDRGFVITTEYVDTVESTEWENRPQFRELVSDLARRDREWTKILAVDTSRIAHRVVQACIFRRECEKRGVDVIFAEIPPMDPVTSVIVEAVCRAFNDIHSFMRPNKDLSGMEE